MALDDIEKKIYRKEDRAKLDAERTHDTPYSIYGKKEPELKSKYEDFEQADTPFFQRHRKQIVKGLLGALVVTVLVALAGYLVTLNQRRFSQDRVTVGIEGTEEIEAGGEVTYTITYTNDNFVALKNPKLSVTTPQALIDPSISILGQERAEVREFELPELAPGETGEITISGRIIAETGSIHFLNATLSYVPDIVSSTFESTSEFSTTVVDSPIVIDIQTPLESVSGDVVEYTVAVNNKSQTELRDMELRLEYPDTFGLTSSSEEPIRGEDVFQIERLRPQAVYELTLTGSLSGESQDVKILKASVGEFAQGVFTLYAAGQNSTRMAAPYVEIDQVIVGNPSRVVRADDNLEYQITFRNNTDVRIGEGSLRAVLDSELLDLSRLRASGADFDASTNTLTWRANSVPQLRSFAPNEQGRVSFTVPVKKVIPIENFEDVNYVIRTKAFFESSEVPTPLGVNKIVQGNETEAKLATRLIVEGQASYANSGSSIVNSGPVPMQVNQATTYTLSWKVQNLTNDVSGVTFTSTLPENVSWTGQFSTGGVGELSYNERTKEVKWIIGDVPANTGILRPLYEAVFQVSVVPAPNQAGEEPRLLSRTSYTGQDDFTGVNLGGTLGEINTGDVSDPNFDGRVAE